MFLSENCFIILTICSFQYSGVFAAFLLVFLGVFGLFAACLFLCVFAVFAIFDFRMPYFGTIFRGNSEDILDEIRTKCEGKIQENKTEQ